MNQQQENMDLTDYTTLRVRASAQEILFVDSMDQLNDFFVSYHQEKKQGKKFFFLGGGSNTFFANDFSGIVWINQLKGKSVEKETEHYALARIASGEIWDEVVDWSLQKGFTGLENLSAIPGTIGGAVVQNIGAYGLELREWVEQVEVFDVVRGQTSVLSADECQFAYRTSIFKAEPNWFVCAVHLRLPKVSRFIPHLDYKELAEWLRQTGADLSPKHIREAVRSLRAKKLPDPHIFPNAGSFFKNPVIDSKHIGILQSQFPEMPFFAQSNGDYKIPAGWLIEKVGWKGKRLGPVGVHSRHALILVNYDHGNGQDMLNLSHQIQQDVQTKFGIWIEPEVVIVRT